jgi:hypothetical protein
MQTRKKRSGIFNVPPPKISKNSTILEFHICKTFVQRSKRMIVFHRKTKNKRIHFYQTCSTRNVQRSVSGRRMFIPIRK